MDRDRVVDYLAALDDDEFAALAADARSNRGDIKAVLEREMRRQGMTALTDAADLIRNELNGDTTA